ncbi:MAG: ABC transporter substrate-binding protein [Halomonas sp.]|uniref:ABC transporter substrate-binding protein n=1 Tax=Halomonas sp. TaxID=1486246 RepID=UPI003F8FB20D
MLSRRHRWPVWLIVLLATGWLSTEPVNADKAVDGQPPAAADLGPQLDTLPAEKASEADKPGYPDQAPLSPSRPQNKNTGSSPILTLSTGQWVSGTIQQWLERYSGRAFSPLAPVPETPAPHAMLSTLSATAPDIVAGPAEPLEPPPTHDLKVMLDWYPSPRHAPLFIAQQRGLFQQRGLEVELVTPADPEAPTKLLAAGRVDLALTRQPLLHLLVNEGKPLTRVASLIRLPLSFLLVGRPDFDDLSLLDGARIGHLDRDGRQVLLPALLDSLGLRPEQIESPKIHFRVDDAIREGRIDAIIGAMQHQVTETLASDGLTTQSYPVAELGVPLHDGLIVIANRDHLEGQRDAIRHFVEALEEATAWIITHPEESWTELTSAEPRINSLYNQKEWPETRARLSLSPAALSQGRYAGFEQYLFDSGIVDKITPVERLALDPGSLPSP